jgi:hypothetical protein
MTTPTGTISLSDIQTEFGGSNPIGINEYYGSGGLVPSGQNVPSSGQISFNDLRGKSKSISIAIDYLIVAGGGGGNSGGGGAGGYLNGTNLLNSGSYTITVGAGGARSTGTTKGVNGTNSVALGLTAIGGGGGGCYSTTPSLRTGVSGGSGGGVGGGSNATPVAGGAGTTGQGNKGGSQTSGGNMKLGGGGAGAAAADYAYPNFTSATGRGGIGRQWLNGNYYAGGGSAASYSPNQINASSQLGGGGAGAYPDSNGSYGYQGTDGTGGGGGGGGFGGGGGRGGNGVVIVRYAGSQQASGGTITSSAGYTYHTFLTSGTLTL